MADLLSNKTHFDLNKTLMSVYAFATITLA